MNYNISKLPTFPDRNGLLTVSEFKDIPFEVKRLFWVYNVHDEEIRGKHAHKKCEQAFVCLAGECFINLDDGMNGLHVKLEHPSEILCVPSMVWVENQYNPDTILLVLCSQEYDKDDYIHDYNEFKRLVEQ